jgi:hypothetical protein
MKDTTKLVRKQITDRRGRVTTVWVDPRTGGTIEGKKGGKSADVSDGRPKPDAAQVKELLENTKSRYLAASESEQKQLMFQLQLQRQQVRNIDWKREREFGEEHAQTTSSRVAAFTEFDKWLADEKAKPKPEKGRKPKSITYDDKEGSYLTPTEKKAVSAIIEQGLMSGKVGRTNYYLSKREDGKYDLTVKKADRGMMPIPGSPLRMSASKFVITVKY